MCGSGISCLSAAMSDPLLQIPSTKILSGAACPGGSTTNAPASWLSSRIGRPESAQDSTGACVILIRPGRTRRESQLSRSLGRDFHNRFCISRVLMQAVHYRRSREKVVKCHVDLGALRNANEWTGYLKCFIFLGECVNLHARTGVGFRVPITLTQFEVKRQDSVPQLSGRFTIGVGLDSRLSRRRLGLSRQFNWCKKYQCTERYCY